MTDPLILTVLIECAALLVLRERDPLFYLYWAALTALTNAPVNLYFRYARLDGIGELCLAAVALEILVFLSEIILCALYKRNLKMAIRYSAVCNVSSVCIGTLIIVITQNLI